MKCHLRKIQQYTLVSKSDSGVAPYAAQRSNLETTVV